MDVNQQRVMMFMAQGYAFICATCKKLHRAADSGYTSGCEAQKLHLDCAGPIGGDGFPLYEGPLARDTMARVCFRCGAAAQHAIKSKRSGLIVGACDEHLELVRSRSTKALTSKRHSI